MASLLPIISDIIPMIMPSTTHVARAADLEPTHPTVEGPVINRPAVVNKCDKMCASGELAWLAGPLLHEPAALIAPALWLLLFPCTH
jgi:hypothetical protein